MRPRRAAPRSLPAQAAPVALAALAALALLAVLAGCGGDDDDGGVSESGDVAVTTPAAAEDTTTTGLEAALPAAIDVVGADYSFDTGGVDAVPAGVVRVTLANDGAEDHQARLVRLNDGVTLEQFVAAASGPSGAAALALSRSFGGPNSVPPGGSGTATAVLDEGDFVMVCFILSPSDGVPHAAKGMVLPFDVTEPDAGAEGELAEGEGRIVAHDFGWDLPDQVAGRASYTFENAGPQVHELAVYAIAGGRTMADVGAFLSPTPPSGPPPIEPAGGIAAVSPGVSATIELDLEPGDYAIVCFLPDTAGNGAPHLTRGMLQGLTIS